MATSDHPDERITLHLPLEACELDDDEVRYSLTVEQWREWLPAFLSRLDGLPATETFVPRGQG